MGCNCTPGDYLERIHMWLERIRHGALQITADGSEPCYFAPRTWQRFYLAWVFRNFRTLPEQVLNDRQQKIIGQICQLDKRMLAVRRASPLLIGTVDSASPTLRKSSQRHLDSSLGRLFISPRLEAIADQVSRSCLSVAVADRATSAEALGVPVRISTGVSLDRQSSAGGQLGCESMPLKVARDYVAQAAAAAHSIHESADNVPASTGKEWLAAACAVLLIVGATIVQHAHSRPPAALLPGSRADAVDLGKHTDIVAKNQMPVIGIEAEAQLAAVGAPGSPAASAAAFDEFSRATPAAKRKAVLFAAPLSIALHAKRPAPALDLPAAVKPSDNVAGYHEADLRPQKIVYPDTSSSAEGHVLLKLMVGPEGNVSDVQVLNGNRNLVKAAVAAVKRWKYAPRHAMTGARSTTTLIHFLGSDAVTVQFPDRTVSSNIR